VGGHPVPEERVRGLQHDRLVAHRGDGKRLKPTVYNFGPETHEAATVREVVEIARRSFGHGDVTWGDGSEGGPHEAGWPSLEIAKARTALGIQPKWRLATTVTRTMDWYRKQSEGDDARKLCDADIAAYESTPLPDSR
jgi:CDP-glucose 4,6-dehydratase